MIGRFPKLPLEPPPVREECREEVEEWDLIVAAGFDPIEDGGYLTIIPDSRSDTPCTCCSGSQEHEYDDEFFPCMACKGEGFFRVSWADN